jgi:hypothetical protein
MSWFVRFTRFGSAHMVRSQDQSNSCAMASIIMINFKMKKSAMFAGMSAGAGLSVSGIPFGSYLGQTLSNAAINYAVKSEAEVSKLYEKVEGKAHDFEKNGAMPDFLPPIMSDLGLGQWESVNVGEAGLVQAVIDATKEAPVLLACVWDAGGGHALVVDECHSFFGTTYFCVCDPWDGELRPIAVTPGTTARYDGSDQPISITFGGDRREYPAGNNKGKFDGRIVRRKKAP